MKSSKSAAEFQTIAALDHIEIMISKQSVKVEDAKYLSDLVSKVLYVCERLRISRDNHKEKRRMAELKLKEATYG